MEMETRYALYFIKADGEPEPMLTIHSIEVGDPATGTSTPSRKEAERTFAINVEPFRNGDFGSIAEIALYEEPAGIMLASTSQEA